MISSEKLMYYVDKKWEPLPKWCRFFISLGETIGGFSKDSSFFVALSLPTRAYAAAFTVLGIIVSRFTQIMLLGHNEAYFEELCSLDPGTPLIYTNRGKHFKAVLYSINSAQKEITIRYGGSKELPEHIIVSQQYADRISVTDGQFSIPKYQKGKDILPAKEFVGSILPPELDVAKFATIQKCECVWVGNRTNINQEINDTELAVQEGDRIGAQGTLQDLIRMKHLVGSASPFLTETIPATSKDPSYRSTKKPFAVIFDGAKGFINWREHFTQSNWIVLLDRTEPEFESGVNLVNQLYFNRSADPTNVIEQKYPPGVELMTFRRG